MKKEKEENKIVFIKNDIFSLIKLAKEQKKEEEKNNLNRKEMMSISYNSKTF